nr:hypothetical protein [Tanacetum cinerariifolium]
ILPNVTPSHLILSRIGTIASFGSTRECFRQSWTGERMPPKTGCQLRAPTATDSSGVPHTIERSPLDFSLEAGASDQGTTALEVPSSGDVPAAAAPEPSQVGVAAADPPAATESRKRGRDGTDANAPPKSL